MSKGTNLALDFLYRPPLTRWLGMEQRIGNLKIPEANSYDMTSCPAQICYRSVHRKLGLHSAICSSLENGRRKFLNHR